MEKLENRQMLAGDMTLFADSFESGSSSNDWAGNWVEDSQNDYFRSTQRSTDGNRSAEVDGWASNATLTMSNPIDLSGYSSVELTFDWLIERGFDRGEYLAVDISSNGGSSWTTSVLQLNGNSDPENQWRSETVDLTPFASSEVLVRFRAKVSRSNEDANVDNVVISGALSANQAPSVDAGPDQSRKDAGGNGDEFVILNGSASDSDGTIVSYEWMNGADVLGTTAQITPTLAVGSHTLTLKATDDDGAIATDTVVITINEVPQTPVKVFLMAGHSNLLGTGYVDNLDPVWNVPQDDVWIWLDHNMDGGQWTTVEPGHGRKTHAPHPTEPEGLEGPDLRLGAELSLSRMLADAYPDHQIALIKHGRGSAALADHFHPDNIGPADSMEHMWSGLTKKIDDSLTILDAGGYSYDVAGMFMVIGGPDGLNRNFGSSDPDEVAAGEDEALARAAEYAENFTYFMQSIRDRYADDVPFISTMLGEEYSPDLLERFPGAPLVRQEQLQVDAADPQASFFEPAGLTMRDTVHFDAMGLVDLGTMFAENYLALVEPTAEAGTDITMIDTDADGSESVLLVGIGNDPNGAIASYEWTDGANFLGNSASIETTLSVGTHLLTLTVTDEEGLTASDTLTVTIAEAPQEPLAEFTPLGFLPGATSSDPRGMSADGRYIVGVSGDQAYRWSRDQGMIDLGTFKADDVSHDGSVVVGGDGESNGYRWENGILSVVGDLTTIGRTEDDPGGTRMSSVHRVSADGSVMVGNTPVINGESDSFRIVGSEIQPLGDLPGGAHNSGARAVSADGSVVVGKGQSVNGGEAYRWENGVFTPLGDLPGGAFFSNAWTVSENGQFVVGQSESAAGIEAYLWSSDTGMVGLGHLPGETPDSRARGVSGDGSVVIGKANDDAFIWDSVNGMRNLQSVLIEEYGMGDALAGWRLRRALAISEDGMIITGHGTNPSGATESFVVDLDPSIDVGNQAPTADAGSDQSITDSDDNGSETVTLSGSGSDVDGSIASYQWTEGATVLGNAASISPSLSIGTHTLTLTVTDNGGASMSDDVVITIVEPMNQDPTANAGADQTLSDNDGTGSENVTLSGDGLDADGSIVAYQWTDGVTVLGDTASISPSLTVGTHTLTLTVTDDDGATASDNLVVTVIANQGPTVAAGADQTVTDNDDNGNETITLTGVASDSDGSIASYQWSDGTTVIGTTASITPTLDVGTHTLTLTVADNGGAISSDSVTVTIESAPVSGPNLSHGNVANVGSSWQTVTLGKSYTSMVIVATPRYNDGSGPGVVRINNVTANSFDVRVDNAGSSSFSGGIHYIAVEEGVYDEPGFKLEAVKYDEAQTSRRSGWGIDTSQGYQQTYNNPVVVGQVMSAKDEDWSVFWASSGSRTSPPTSSTLNVGKHVAEDPDTTRATETIGYLVIEATQEGTIEGLPFVAGVGGDSVRGVGNGTNQYSYDAMPNAKTAVLSSAGMDGNDGGWAVLRGNDPVPASSGTISLSIDEDQLRDSERNHTTEQVAYFVIDPPVGESFQSNETIPVTVPLAETPSGVKVDSIQRDTAAEIPGSPKKLVSIACSPEIGKRPSWIELIDTALSDSDNDWSMSEVADLLVSSRISRASFGPH